MKNVIILGASGNIAKHVIDNLVKNDGIHLTLFLRNKSRLRNKDVSKCRIIEGNVLDYKKLEEVITGQDIVYANLAGDLEAMAKNIVKAMEETGVKRIIAISSIGIYDSPLKSVLIPYRKLADVIGNKKIVSPFPIKIRESLILIKSLLEQDKFRPMIDREFPMEQIVEAFKYVEKGQKTGNVIITVDHNDKT